MKILDSLLKILLCDRGIYKSFSIVFQQTVDLRKSCIPWTYGSRYNGILCFQWKKFVGS